MEAGAVGLSTDLTRPPALYALPDEIAALCQVAGAYGGRYYTRIRNEGDHLIEAIDEALAIEAKASIPVHLFQLKAAGQENWPKMELALARLKTARQVGQEVDADIYPYLHARLNLTAFVHPRHLDQGEPGFRRQLDSASDRAVIRREMEEGEDWDNWFRRCGRDWDRVILGQIQAPSYRHLNGKSVGEIARNVRKDPWTVFFEVVRSGATAFPESVSEPNQIQALQQDFVSFCTEDGPVGSANSAGHPRAYGSFPRVLAHYVRELGTLSLERAVSHMTSLPANQILAYDRGRLAEGLAADVALFDPGTVRDRATFTKPSIEAEGIAFVVVNGQVVFDHGKFTGALPGRVLRGPGYR
jgi:N-acyl-D-amino-acid deacylase